MLLISASRQYKLFGLAKTIAKIVLTIVVCFILLAIYARLTVCHVTISGNSMMPVIYDGDRLRMSRLFTAPEVGEIYSIKAGATAANQNVGLLKRVIAGPGDVLEFHAATGEWLSYNGVKVVITENRDLKSYKSYSKEPDSYGALLSVQGGFNQLSNLPLYRLQPNQPLYSAEQKRYYKTMLHYPYIQGRASIDGITKVTVPPGHYFVMSDNWTGNLDSRYFGPLPERVFDYRLVSKQKPKSS